MEFCKQHLARERGALWYEVLKAALVVWVGLLIGTACHSVLIGMSCL